ncbi:hypothetical protein NP511_05330 [Natrinema thermotolerans]|uniref:Uncharacterized protein n=1 Tax=Natrinema thermotolerans TaxID=121872 RepID=A0AAF0PD97_9EURY|nr:hypothetical protein [Natrinema thermotolerans]ELZ12935.1 hypothetical protein C478_08428 [Natrinema thermotolerans DSM 11552]QCC57959.1 hypothetical protein DVR14_04610 [Natrinema thermotolerans]WMT09055.1 hypothetical protein NP511_05330 [Natrinema thermotolerans]
MERREPIREWFRDDDGDWRFPEGRRGEFVVLVVGLPLYAWVADVYVGLPAVVDYWPAVLLGACCGFSYTTRYRDRIVDRLPDWAPASQLLSLLVGGIGLDLLEIVQLADPFVTLLLTAGCTAMLISLIRLASPFHRGLEPPRRGVEPPTAVGEPRTGTDR